MVDAFVFKLPTKLAVVAQKNELLIQEINRVTLTSEMRRIHDLLTTVLVLAENFNFSSGRDYQSNSRRTNVRVWGLWLVTAFDAGNYRRLLCHVTRVTI